MVKPVFKALNEMKAAGTAQEAQAIGLAFLRSADAQTVDSSRAGTFAKALQGVFDKHKAPEIFNAFLEEATSPNTKASQDLKVSLGFVKTDFRAAINYKEEASAVIANNAIVLKGLKEAPPKGFKFPEHYGSNEPEPEAKYPELASVQDADDLKRSINFILCEQDITEEKAEGFLAEINCAFKVLKLSAHDKIEILNDLQDSSSSESTLFDLANEQANQLIEKSQGPAPKTAHTGGIELKMP